MLSEYLFSRQMCIRDRPPSRNVTVPVVTGFPPLVTVAVNLTDCPGPFNAGLLLEVTVVVLVTPVLSVRVTHQPPSRLAATPDQP